MYRHQFWNVMSFLSRWASFYLKLLKHWKQTKYVSGWAGCLASTQCSVHVPVSDNNTDYWLTDILKTPVPCHNILIGVFNLSCQCKSFHKKSVYLRLQKYLCIYLSSCYRFYLLKCNHVREQMPLWAKLSCTIESKIFDDKLIWHLWWPFWCSYYHSKCLKNCLGSGGDV